MLHTLSDIVAAVAGQLRNEGFTVPYASPQQLLKDEQGQCPKANDAKSDMWAVGPNLHTMLTCANPDWHMAFDPSPAAGQGLHADQQDAAQEARVLHHQQEWVSFCCAHRLCCR